MALAKRAWFVIAFAVLAIGIVGALSNLVPSDTGIGVLWFLVAGLMAFPLGTVFFVLVLLLLALIERAVLGPETHFAALAQICLLWSAAMLGGVLQGAMLRRWRNLAKERRNAN